MPDPQLFTDDAAIAHIGEGMIACTLPAREWTHAAHWAAALWIIARRPDFHAPAAMPTLIRRYNESTGGQNTDTSGYHETITQASLRAALSVLNEAKAQSREPLWQSLNRLLASPLGRPDWLMAYWRKETLMSVAARRDWVEPDLAPLPFPVFPASA
jgi:hypothetical protein